MDENRLNNEAHEAPTASSESVKKPFFKSVSFKCIVTLLCVLLISGIFLTIMSGLLAVSDEERFERALAKIYGGSVKTTEISLEGQTTNFENWQIDAAYSVDDGNYLVKSTGKNGYENGTVTCWVVVKLSSDGKAITGVGNVVIDSAKSQSYLSLITSSHLAKISEIAYTDGKEYECGYKIGTKDAGADYIPTGASYSMCAVSCAVNGAISFVKSYALGVTVEEKTPFDEFEYTERINKKATSVEFKDGFVTYTVKTKSNPDADPFTVEIAVNAEKKIESYKVVVNGSTEYEGTDFKDLMYSVKNYEGKNATELAAMLDDGTISTGATKSNTLCLHAALFAAANYDKAFELCYKNTTRINFASTKWSVDGENVTYTVVTKGFGDADPFTIEIKVNAEKKVEAFKITTNGSTLNYGDNMMNVSTLVGKNAEELAAMLDNGTISTGATKSNTLCVNAALFATSNYEIAIATGGKN